MGLFGSSKNKEEKQKNKILQKAQKFARKGQIDKAVAEWERLLQNKAEDANIYNTIGDLYLKGKQQENAIEAYNKASQIHSDSGFSLKAIAVNKKILKLDPQNIDALTGMAHLHKERGMVKNAKECYLSIAEHHMRAGSHDKALEAYQYIVNMDPKNLKVKLGLAELYLKEHMTDEGAKIYGEVIGALLDQDRHEDAEKLCTKVKETLPSPDAILPYIVQIQLAKGNIDEAYDSCKQLEAQNGQDPEVAVLKAEILIRKGQTEDGLAVLRSIDRGNITEFSQLKIFRYLLEAKELDQALEVINDLGEKYTDSLRYEELLAQYLKILEHDGDHLKTRQRTADLLKKMKRDPEVIQQYKEIGRIYAASGQKEEACNIYEKVLDMTPGDLEVQAMIKKLSGKGGTSEFGEVPLNAGAEIETAESPQEEIQVIDSDTVIETMESTSDEQAEEPFEEAVVSATGSSAGEIEEVDAVEEIDQDRDSMLADNITEADVYIKYGHAKKAMVHLDKNLEVSPRHLPTHERFLQIFVNDGNTQEQINTLLILANLYQAKGEQEKSEEALNEVLALDPENAQAQQALQQDAPVSASDAVEEAPAEVENLNFEFDDEDKAEAPSSVEETREIELSEDLSGSEGSIDDLMDEANFYLQNGMVDEARTIYEKILALHPDRSDVAKQLEEIAGNGKAAAVPSEETVQSGPEAAEEIVEIQEAAVLEDEVEIAASSDAAETEEAEPAPQMAAEFDSFADELRDEVSSSVAGILEEMGETDEVEVPDVEASKEYSDFDSELRKEVEDSIAAEAQAFGESDVMDIFSEFREGVQRELGDEDHETHYNLGIAYLEMGLIDEAREEFSIASKDPKRMMDCISMIGLCYIQKGDYEKALTELEKGMAMEGRTDQEYIGIRYEIAKVCEQLGNKERAGQEFLKVYEINPKYREVATKLDELGVACKAPSPEIIKITPKKNKVSYL